MNLDIGNVEAPAEKEKSNKCHPDEIEYSKRDTQITSQQCNFTNHSTNEGEFYGTEANFTNSDTNEHSEVTAIGDMKKVCSTNQDEIKNQDSEYFENESHEWMKKTETEHIETMTKLSCPTESANSNNQKLELVNQLESTFEDMESVIVISDSEEETVMPSKSPNQNFIPGDTIEPYDSDEDIKPAQTVVQNPVPEETEVEEILVPKIPTVCSCDKFSPSDSVCQLCRNFQVKAVGVLGNILLAEIIDGDGVVANKYVKFTTNISDRNGIKLDLSENATARNPFGQICKVYSDKYILMSLVSNQNPNPEKGNYLFGGCQIWLDSFHEDNVERLIFLQDVKIDDDGTFLLTCYSHISSPCSVQMVSSVNTNLSIEDQNKIIPVNQSGVVQIKCKKKKIDFLPNTKETIGSVTHELHPELVMKLVRRIQDQEAKQSKAAGTPPALHKVVKTATTPVSSRRKISNDSTMKPTTPKVQIKLKNPLKVNKSAAANEAFNSNDASDDEENNAEQLNNTPPPRKLSKVAGIEENQRRLNFPPPVSAVQPRCQKCCFTHEVLMKVVSEKGLEKCTSCRIFRLTVVNQITIGPRETKSVKVKLDNGPQNGNVKVFTNSSDDGVLQVPMVLGPHQNAVVPKRMLGGCFDVTIHNKLNKPTTLLPQRVVGDAQLIHTNSLHQYQGWQISAIK